MPQILSKLELHRVNDVLRKRGWAFHSQTGVGLRLTKADPNPENNFKTSGRPRRLLMTPIGRVHLDEILSYSRNIQEAVEQIEAISVGAQLAPEFAHPGARDAQGVDPVVMEKLMAQRVENEVAKVTQANNQRMAELLEANAKLAAKVDALAESHPTPQQNADKRASKKKVSKKATTRKQPKGGVLDRLKAKGVEMDENGEPILTAEQEADLAKAMANAGRQD